MKKMSTISLLLTAAVLLMLTISSIVNAHNRVVVVPLNSSKDKSFCIGSQTNSVGMTFSLLPSGTFTMGSPEDEYARSPYETQHQVTLTKPFYIQTTEVTQAQWNAVIVDKLRGTNPSTFSGESHPVENVNWYEAASFANWLSYDEGLIPCYGYDSCTGAIGTNFECTNVSIISGCSGYLLPTEAQWEFAARAGTTTATYIGELTTRFSCDEVDPNLDPIAWFRCNSSDKTHIVAWKKPNDCGLYDMLGNVSELCQDWGDALTDYSPDPVVDPTGDPVGTTRVVRGGMYSGWSDYNRAAHRRHATPSYRWQRTGFRLIKYHD